ncbi:hypothetical protein GCM10009827_110990 [Dactylosporangium maewongense]|uniref:DUF3263 domain-containing protein n=1 Tax=Dactylosporangium maewongense TaxID=634393 RepID=A0ABP4P515_9ACTN
MQRDDLTAARVPAQPPTQDPDDFVDTDVADTDEDPDAGPDLATAEEPPELDERSKAILAFERRWWRQAGAKEQAVHDTFNLSATRYYQLLNTLLDDPLALAHDPVVVQRLRRLRASRSRRR